MEYLIAAALMIVFMFLVINQLYIYAFLSLIVFVVFVFFKLRKKQHDYSLFNSNNVEPLMEEQEDGSKGYIYTLNDTASRQQVIEQAILYDNNNSLVDREFEGLSDEDIFHFEKDESKKIYQYQDKFGIGDYKFGIINKELGLPVLIRIEHEYSLVGYLNYDDATYFITNTNSVASHRLIYQGGYYKQIIMNNLEKNEVVTNYEDYVLKLVIFYKKKKSNI